MRRPLDDELALDPFPVGRGQFVPLPSHLRTLAALDRAIRSGERILGLRGPAGVGKSAVVAEALRRLSPSCELIIARVAEPLDWESLTDGLTEILGRPLVQAARLARLQAKRLVLILDGDQWLEPAAQDRFAHLSRIDPHPFSRVGVLQIGRESFDASDRRLAIGLTPLGFAELSAYIQNRIVAAGGSSKLFSPPAMSLLHEAAEGLPGRAEALARAALVAASGRELSTIDARSMAEAIDATGPRLLGSTMVA